MNKFIGFGSQVINISHINRLKVIRNKDNRFNIRAFLSDGTCHDDDKFDNSNDVYKKLENICINQSVINVVRMTKLSDKYFNVEEGKYILLYVRDGDEFSYCIGRGVGDNYVSGVKGSEIISYAYLDDTPQLR